MGISGVELARVPPQSSTFAGMQLGSLLVLLLATTGFILPLRIPLPPDLVSCTKCRCPYDSRLGPPSPPPLSQFWEIEDWYSTLKAGSCGRCTGCMYGISLGFIEVCFSCPYSLPLCRSHWPSSNYTFVVWVTTPCLHHVFPVYPSGWVTQCLLVVPPGLSRGRALDPCHLLAVWPFFRTFLFSWLGVQHWLGVFRAWPSSYIVIT